MPEWLVTRKSMQEVDSYIRSLYDLANSQSDTKSQEKRRNLLDTLADLQLDLKVSTLDRFAWGILTAICSRRLSKLKSPRFCSVER